MFLMFNCVVAFVAKKNYYSNCHINFTTS